MAKFNFIFNAILKKLFADVKISVLLIILPACFISSFYFHSNLKDTFMTKNPDRVAEYSRIFAPLKEDLPKQAAVNYYLGDQDYQKRDFFIAAYVLIPVRVIRGLAPKQKYLIFFDYLNQAKIPEFKDYRLKRKYGNGIALFER